MANYRSCPHCNYEYSISYFLKRVFTVFIWKSWQCVSCNYNLKFSVPWRVISAIGQIMILYLLLIFRDQVTDEWYWYVIVILVLISTITLLSFLNRFRIAKKR